MQLTSILSVVITVTAVVAIFFVPGQESELESEFYGFMTKYGKSYNSQTEVEFRMAVFRQNMEEAREQSRLNPDATFGVNEFADMTTEEFSKMLGEIDSNMGTPTEYFTETAEPNGDKSWVSKMSPIQNQGSCGSCWAFAATATYETYSNILGKGLTKLSEQELVDCVKTCSGCGGGLAHLAYEWLSQKDASTNAFCTLASYPYKTTQQTCNSSKCTRASFSRDAGYGIISTGEKGMIAKLQQGPISVSVDASVWKTYTGGVLTTCGVATNHAVVVSAFHDAGKQSYWTIRNSWGTGWGLNGYINVQYGENVCNIEKRPSYPTF